MTRSSAKRLTRRRLLSGAGAVGGTVALESIVDAVRASSRAGSSRPPTSSTQAAPHRSPGLRANSAVAIGACADYGASQVEAVLRDLIEQLGGLGEVIHAGDTVVIKPNLTGGGLWPMPDGQPSVLTYVTHPDVVRAIALLAREAGAARILLAEAHALSAWEHNGYTPMLAELDLELLNLASPSPLSWYKRVPVPSAMVYDHIWMTETLANADVYISVPKLKCHVNAGITLSIKNSVACMPTEIYRVRSTDTSRTELHAGNWSVRLPSLLVDLLKARPIDFCVIDGISTIDQGEGPWNQGQAGISLRTVQPGLLIAGRNPVAVDAVGAACIGFDPEAPPFTDAFLSGWNHLALASAAGLGPNALNDIDRFGLPLEQAVYPFTPCPNQSGITPTPTATVSVTDTPYPTSTATPQPTATETPRPTETPTPPHAHDWLPLIQNNAE